MSPPGEGWPITLTRRQTPVAFPFFSRELELLAFLQQGVGRRPQLLHLVAGVATKRALVSPPSEGWPITLTRRQTLVRWFVSGGSVADPSYYTPERKGNSAVSRGKSKYKTREATKLLPFLQQGVGRRPQLLHLVAGVATKRALVSPPSEGWPITLTRRQTLVRWFVSGGSVADPSYYTPECKGSLVASLVLRLG